MSYPIHIACWVDEFPSTWSYPLPNGVWPLYKCISYGKKNFRPRLTQWLTLCSWPWIDECCHPPDTVQWPPCTLHPPWSGPRQSTQWSSGSHTWETACVCVCVCVCVWPYQAMIVQGQCLCSYLPTHPLEPTFDESNYLRPTISWYW